MPAAAAPAAGQPIAAAVGDSTLLAAVAAAGMMMEVGRAVAPTHSEEELQPDGQSSAQDHPAMNDDKKVCRQETG